MTPISVFEISAPSCTFSHTVDVQRVDSSVLAAVGYDAERHVLDATFRTGRVYRYFDVPAAVHKALMKAPSVGQYFNRNIRSRYRSELVYDPRRGMIR